MTNTLLSSFFYLPPLSLLSQGNGTSSDPDQFAVQWRTTAFLTEQFWYLGLADMSIIEAFIHGTARLLADDGPFAASLNFQVIQGLAH